MFFLTSDINSGILPPVRLKRLYLSAESAQSWVNLQRKCCQMLVLFLHPLDKRAVFWCVWLWRTWCWPSSCSAAGEHCWQTGAAVQPVRASKEPFFSPEWESDLQQNGVLPVPFPDLSRLLTVRGGSVLVHVIVLSSMKTDMKENWFLSLSRAVSVDFSNVNKGIVDYLIDWLLLTLRGFFLSIEIWLTLDFK